MNARIPLNARIVVLDGHALNPGDLDWSTLGALGSLDVFPRSNHDEVLDRARNADAVLINKTPLDRETLQQLSTLKYVGVMATGVNSVDLDAARDCEITVTNVPGYSTASVAQHVFALLLSLTNHVAAHSHAVRDGAWTACPDWCFWDSPLIELAGRTMGIVGYGQIGRATAAIAQAMGMSVNVVTRTPIGQTPNLQQVDLPQLFTASDVISLHCPLTEQTRHLVDRRQLSKMRKTAFLINTARGALVDEQALADALNAEALAGAGIDVLDVEPPTATQPLLTAKNCVITPHNAWATRAARERLLAEVVQNLAAFLAGTTRNVVS